MVQLNSYLNFNGNCREAFEFYERCLDGRIESMLTWGEAPFADQVPQAMHQRVMHASIAVGRSVLMGSDSPQDHPYEGVKGAHVTINVDDPAQAERIFEDLSDGGRITMRMEETFWAIRFGMLFDRFGVPWMVNCSKPGP